MLQSIDWVRMGALQYPIVQFGTNAEPLRSGASGTCSIMRRISLGARHAAVLLALLMRGICAIISSVMSE